MRAAGAYALACALAAWTVRAAAADEGPQVVVEVGPKRVASWGNHPGHVQHPRHTILATLDSGAERYGLRYSCCPHPSHAPGVATPEGYIGMPLPTSVNWYHNGFLRIVVNGRDIGTTPLAALRRGETGRRGSVQFVWRRADADVRATFLMLPQDPTLYFEATAHPKGELRSLEVALTAYPVAYVSNADRWAITPRRGIQQGHKETLDPAAEPWLLCQDHALARSSDTSPHPGGCGLQLLPAEIDEARVEVHSYPVQVHLKAKPGLRRLRLAIWDFHKRTNRDAERWVRSRASATAAALASLDFTNPVLRGEAWPQLRAHLMKILPSAKGYPKLHADVTRHVERVDALLAQLRAAAAKGTATPLDAEDRLLESLDALARRRWELEFVALFAE